MLTPPPASERLRTIVRPRILIPESVSRLDSFETPEEIVFELFNECIYEGFLVNFSIDLDDVYSCIAALDYFLFVEMGRKGFRRRFPIIDFSDRMCDFVSILECDEVDIVKLDLIADVFLCEIEDICIKKMPPSPLYCSLAFVASPVVSRLLLLFSDLLAFCVFVLSEFTMQYFCVISWFWGTFIYLYAVEFSPSVNRKLVRIANRFLEKIGDCVASRTRRRSPIITPAQVRVIDGNRVTNVAQINLAYSRGIVPKLHGYTLVWEHKFPFPVYCDPQTVIRFFAMYCDSPRDVRLAIDNFGKLECNDPRVFYLMKPLFSPILKFTWLATFEDPFVMQMCDVLMCILFPGATFCYHLLDRFIRTFPRMNMTPTALNYVVVEELLNGYFGVSPIIFYETYTRAHHGAVVLVPIVVHVILSFIPYLWIRVILHLIYNFLVSITEEWLPASISPTDDDPFLHIVADGAYFVDLARKIYGRDVIGVILSLTMKVNYIERLKRLMDVDLSDDSFVQNVINTVVDDNGADWIDEETTRSRLFEWIPIDIRKSPMFSKMTAFLSLLLFSRWFKNLEGLQTVGQYIAGDDFVECSDIASISATAVAAVVKALKRVYEKNDWMAFLDAPRDVTFIEEANNFLFEGDTRDNEETILSKIAQVNELLSRRRLLVNSVLVQRTIEKLQFYVLERKKYITTWKPRPQPMAIWMNGAPGTGKTTAVDMLCDMQAMHENRERFDGDVIHFQINDKYPTSIGANSLAPFLVMNDIPNNYAEFAKQDLLPADIAMQMILDVSPCCFRAAAVEDKGKVLNKLELMIVTSNHMSYRMGGETEKLHRRLESGVLVDVFVVNEEGKRVSYSVFKDYPQELRNSRLRYQILNPVCKDFHLSFEKTQIIYDLKGFCEYTLMRWAKHKESAAHSVRNFSSSAPKCSCGISKTNHVTRYMDMDNVYKALLPSCSASSAVGYKCFVDHKGVVSGLACSFMNQPGDRVMLLLLVTLYCYPYLFVVLGLVLGVFSWWYFSFVESFVRDFFKRELGKMEQAVASFSVENPLGNSFLKSYYGEQRYAAMFPLLKAKFEFAKFTRWFEEHKTALIAAGAATAILAIWKLTSKRPEFYATPIYAEQVKPDSIFLKEVKKERSFPEATQRTWGKESMEFRQAVVQTHGVSRKDIKALCRTAMSSARLGVSGEWKTVNVFFLLPEYMLMNKHYIFLNGNFLAKTFTLTIDEVTKEFSCDDLIGSAESEFYLVKHFFPRHSKGLANFLPMEHVEQSLDIEHLHCVESSVAVVANPRVVTLGGASYQTLVWREEGIKGMCGEPVIGVIGGNAVLVGFVSFGFQGKGELGASLVSRKWLDKVIDGVRVRPVMDVVVEIPFDKVLPLASNSELRNHDTPYIVALGTADAVGKSFHSSLKPTRLLPYFAPLMSKAFVPPLKIKTVLDGAYYSSLSNTLTNIGYDCDLTQGETQQCVNMMLERLEPTIKTHGIKLSPLDLSEAIFGCPELGIDRVDFKTSVGAYLKKMGISSKYQMFDQVEDEYVFKKEVLERVREFETDFRNGIVRAPYSEMVHKDELRPIEKVEKCKVRLFSVLDSAYNIFIRMYVMPLIQLLLRFPEVSECYGGMNAGSVQWHRLATRLKKMKLHLDMDFSTFDWSHCAELFDAAAKFFMFLALMVGYSEEDAQMVHDIFVSFRWQISSLKNDIFMKYKGMPSGVIFTLAMNSFINSFLMRVAFVRLVLSRGLNLKFDDCVNTANVGDDNASGIDDRLEFVYNTVTIAAEYKKLGYVATPAMKTNVIQPFVLFEDLTFLKRKLVFSEEIGEYVGPIEKDSIYKSFTYEKSDAKISSVQRLMDVAGGAQREAFLHGRTFFESFGVTLDKSFSKEGMQYTKLGYEALLEEYKSGDFRTFML